MYGRRGVYTKWVAILFVLPGSHVNAITTDGDWFECFRHHSEPVPENWELRNNTRLAVRIPAQGDDADTMARVSDDYDIAKRFYLLQYISTIEPSLGGTSRVGLVAEFDAIRRFGPVGPHITDGTSAHNFLEIGLNVDGNVVQFLSDPGYCGLNLHWTMFRDSNRIDVPDDTPLTPVTEPATIVLLGIGLMGLALRPRGPQC